jgi:predicted dehydrogenase
MSIRFGAIGLSHNHIFNMTEALRRAGAEAVSFYGDEPEQIAAFTERFPGVRQAASALEILEDDSLHLIVSAAIPDERAPLGIRAMQHGKDYLCTKPGFTTLEQLAEVERIAQETTRRYTVYFGERVGNAATVKAGELVHAGAIGRVVQTTGFGPHKIGQNFRPEWFYEYAHYGGVLNDLASHQIDQFLYLTGSTSASVVAAQAGNFHHPQHPGLQDFGDMMLTSDHATGYIRVDWLTPDGLNTWGDVRLFIQGTEGYIEVRKNCDIAGRDGKDHLFIVDKNSTRYIDCAGTELPFAGQYIDDLLNRTENAIGQAHVFMASRLAMQAQSMARLIAP